MTDPHLQANKFNAWKDLQKDLDARKYKTNPFEQKYVDLTTSSCVADDLTAEDDFGLEFLSKSIRARTDIISCQVAHLLKEMVDVSENFLAAKDVEEDHPKKKKLKNRLEVDDYSNLFICKKGVSDSHREEKFQSTDPDAQSDDAELLWVEELARSLEPSVIKDISRPFFDSRQQFVDPVGSTNSNESKKLILNFADYCSTDGLISLM
jgi:hypothetical protein